MSMIPSTAFDAAVSWDLVGVELWHAGLLTATFATCEEITLLQIYVIFHLGNEVGDQLHLAKHIE